MTINNWINWIKWTIIMTPHTKNRKQRTDRKFFFFFPDFWLHPYLCVNALQVMPTSECSDFTCKKRSVYFHCCFRKLSTFIMSNAVEKTTCLRCVVKCCYSGFGPWGRPTAPQCFHPICKYWDLRSSQHTRHLLAEPEVVKVRQSGP